MGRVADPRREEPVQGRRQPPITRAIDQAGAASDEDEHAPEREPDEVRDGEREAEEHRQPRPAYLVAELEPHGVGRELD